MRRVCRILPVAAAAVALQFGAGAQQPTPQYRVPSVSDLNGAPALSMAMRRLKNTSALVHATAHPDDENNAMLALYARQEGARVALVTATRGDGGQNEIGPELFDALGILRTEELLAAHRFDGAEQYFTRAVDFGYSFSPEETLEKWGREEILGDYVRHIRAIRPEVIVGMSPDGAGGGQHHQTAGLLTIEAFRAAADPARFPEQIKEGLRPWQALKLYRPAFGFGGRGGRGAPGGQRGGGRAAGPPAAPAADGTIATLDTNRFEPLLGCTIGEIGGVASGMHMCQGRVPLVPPAGGGGFGGRGQYRLTDSSLPKPAAEQSLFQGIDTTLAGLARFAQGKAPDALTAGLAAIASRVDAASRTLDGGNTFGTVPDLAGALTATRDLRARLDGLGLGDAATYEIRHRLTLKESQIQDAIVIAHGLRLDATANDGLIVAGQPLGVTVAVANRGGGDLRIASVSLQGLEGAACAAGTASLSAAYTCTADGRVPQAARPTDVYWQRPEDAGRATFAADAPFGLPFTPTPFTARVELDLAGVRVTRELPIQFRYDGAGLVGEKRMELNVVPALAVSVSPAIVVVPARAASSRTSAREVRVTVVNGGKGAAAASVRLEAPSGWRVTPASAPIEFTREDESTTTRFTVTPPAGVRAGEMKLTAVATPDGGASFSTGYQAIEYPHIQRRQKIVPATARLKVIDVSVPAALRVGYIMGVGDQVPPALRQLGADITLIDSDELAWGDLSRYHTIVTGVRAYERRADLRANNHRLLKYVENGGTAIVQYNRQEFNQAQYGPYKAVVSSERITDEHAPVKVLLPAHPVFNVPNRIGERDWAGWVQERGTYFLGEADSRYVNLVEMEDPFEYNRGAKRGALVEARYGKGRWIYVGLVLWRQLPSGTEGAYRLFANLISLGKPPVAAKPKPLAVER